jgi:hypothetical protein
MRSPLELLRGQYEHALLTTYSFNLRFFEEWVLRSLWAAEVRNVVVFVDRSQLGAALLDRAPTLAGRAYHLVSGSSAKHAFHPKLLLVSGREGARLCVSSANLTADGQLRNAESAIAFDANLAGHRRPILEAGDLFRRLSAEAPPHTASAIQAALAALPEEDAEDSPYRLLHNLDRPLLDSFPPSGRIRAIAPFVDADGTAARSLHERGELTVIVDGEEIAAAPEFFAAAWNVEARRFEARLHGKAYEVTSPEGRWVLVGSPNLSRAALVQPASAGNLEVAVAVADAEELALPPSQPWEGGAAIADAAAARLAVAPTAADPAAPASFDAWEEGARIIVYGIPEGAAVERWSAGRWQPFGTVTDGAVLNPDPSLRPARLRAVSEDGRVAFAVVSQPAALKARLHARVGGRQTEAVERLPLDVETVRILEEALAQLYALSELAGEVPAGGRRPPPRDPNAPGAAEELSSEWMPRSPEEEPRVPPVYAKGWEGEPDALLALVSRVLRLDAAEQSGGEIDVEREGLEIEELEGVTGSGEVGVAAEEEPPIRVEAEELERYRRAFRRLFQRGEDFLASSLDPTLAGWAFTYLLRLVEDLGSHSVEVNGQMESLMPRDDLRAISLDVLERYLGRGEADPLCLATARAHLAVAIRDRARYSSRDGERLEVLAYRWATELVSVPVDLPAPAPATIGMDALTAISRLEDYARRSQWEGVVGQAEGVLEDVRLDPEPWPVIVGSVSGLDRTRSPAWSLLGFAAPVGYATPDPFGLVVENEGPGSISVQVLICVPADKEIIEAWRRRTDEVWVERRYGAPTVGTVRRLEGQPTSLSVTMASTERGEILAGCGELSELVTRLGLDRATGAPLDAGRG